MVPENTEPIPEDAPSDFYSKENRKRRKRARRRRTQDLLTWTLGPLLFLGLLILAAKTGIQMAENDLPESARRTTGYAVGAVVIAGSDGAPVFLAETVQDLRDFHFKYPTPEARRDGDFSKFNVRRIFGRVELATLKSDADAVRVQVRSGPLADTMYWIHVDQLPKTR